MATINIDMVSRLQLVLRNCVTPIREKDFHRHNNSRRLFALFRQVDRLMGSKLSRFEDWIFSLSRWDLRMMLKNFTALCTRPLLSVYRLNLHRHLFTASCFCYSWLYDDFKHPYLSRIYKQNKYGVVINYFILSLMSLASQVVMLNNAFSTLALQRRINEQQQVSGALSDYTTAVIGTGNIDRLKLNRPLFSDILHFDLMPAATPHIFIAVFTTILKTLIFNFIFKNNTSDLPLQKRAHLVCVSLMFGVSVLSALHLDQYVPQPFYFVRKLTRMISLGVSFQAVGWYAESHKSLGFNLLSAML